MQNILHLPFLSPCCLRSQGLKYPIQQTPLSQFAIPIDDTHFIDSSGEERGDNSVGYTPESLDESYTYAPDESPPPSERAVRVFASTPALPDMLPKSQTETGVLPVELQFNQMVSRKLSKQGMTGTDSIAEVPCVVPPLHMEAPVKAIEKAPELLQKTSRISEDIEIELETTSVKETGEVVAIAVPSTQVEDAAVVYSRHNSIGGIVRHPTTHYSHNPVRCSSDEMFVIKRKP